ncbi:hypothetical protein TNCV_1401051 [Trichonephila clavipes]|nr:hypothetical protein TNCV_1401051 [Trichonephila clavipes]
MLKHLCSDVFESQETKLPVRLINTTNEHYSITRGHETTALRVQGDIKDVSTELYNGGERMHFLDETSQNSVVLSELGT